MNKNRTIVIVVITVLVVVIVVLAGMSWHQHAAMSEMVEQMEWEKEQLENEYEDLAIQFDGYQDMNIRNDSLQDQLNREQQRVRDLLEELRVTKVTNARRIAELKKELATVRAVLADYVVQIDSLNRTNERLTAENTQYRQQYTEVAQQAQQLQEEKTQLTEVVTRAAMLEVTDFSVLMLNKNDRKTRMFSHAAKLQFDYMIAKNITTDPGMKQVYLRLVTPEGELLSTDTTHVFDYENGQIGYSLMQELEYGGGETPGTLYWRMQGGEQKGIYNADFFIDGSLVGSFPFELK